MNLYEHFRVVTNDVGVQVGRRHFEVDRLPDYLEASGTPKLAMKLDQMVGTANSFAKAERIKMSLAGLPGGDLVQNSADRDRISKEAAIANYALVAADYNARLAYALGLSLSPAETSGKKSRPQPFAQAQFQAGDNASLADWVADYQLWFIASQWQIGYQKVSQADVAGELRRLGAPESDSFATGQTWSQVAGWTQGLGVIATAVGAACLFFGSGNPDLPVDIIAGGLGVWAVGCGIGFGANGAMASAQTAYNDSLAGRLQQRAPQ